MKTCDSLASATATRPKRSVTRGWLSGALCLLLLGCATTPSKTSVSPNTAVATSPATTPAQAGLVDVRERVPDVDVELRYAGSDNFVGAPVEGYEAPRCYLLRPVAEALARVERDLRAQRMRLRIYDCYRPVRAVRHFMRWVDDDADQRTKDAYYPRLEKRQLRGDYIAPVSGHSRGATLDLTLMRCDVSLSICTPLDMGTPFDFFDVSAHTEAPGIAPAQSANRQRLRTAMEREGFRNYPMEWWHYTFQPEPAPDMQYDVPVR